MSFTIRNKTSGPSVAIDIRDITVHVPAGADVSLTTSNALQVAKSADLLSRIAAGDIVVLDPLDGTTELSSSDSAAVVVSANDPHWRLGAGARIGDLGDVDLTGISDGEPIVYSSGTFVAGSAEAITLSTIGGNLVPTFVDTGRSSKVLSVECPAYMWSEAIVTDGEWYAIGNATNSDSSYIMPFDGTIVGITAHCEDDNGQGKGIDLVINTGAGTSLGSFGGVGNNSTIVDNTLNIDFSAGDRLRLQSDNVGGYIEDTVVTLRVRWRG